ncbi:hypothetical protein EGW08_002313 [Elysia chlorotica]|uniref:Uncharacterized protein n=1 Tax=Elysia chlorotica TaxID=188477 RepID=A0A3S1CDT1_ELYCH|nr:hypothetical protein EGW08_002313 [Elysia chlorotica]
MKLTLTLVYMAALVLCVQCMPGRFRRDANDIVAETARIAAKEDSDVSNFVASEQQALSDASSLVSQLQADSSDPAKLQADLAKIPAAANQASSAGENFQAQWEADVAAGDRLAAQVQQANLPPDAQAVANMADAIQSEAKANVQALSSGWADLQQEAAGLDNTVSAGQGSVQLDIKDAAQFVKDVQSGLDAFVNDMEGVRAKAKALVAEVDG